MLYSATITFPIFNLQISIYKLDDFTNIVPKNRRLDVEIQLNSRLCLSVGKLHVNPVAYSAITWMNVWAFFDHSSVNTGPWNLKLYNLWFTACFFKRSLPSACTQWLCTARPGVPFVILCTYEASNTHFWVNIENTYWQAITQLVIVFCLSDHAKSRGEWTRWWVLTFGTRNWTVRDIPPSHEAISIMKPANITVEMYYHLPRNHLSFSNIYLQYLMYSRHCRLASLKRHCLPLKQESNCHTGQEDVSVVPLSYNILQL